MKKFMELKNKYHPPTVYRNVMQKDSKERSLKDYFFVILFYFIAFFILFRTYVWIMNSEDPQGNMIKAILFMIGFAIFIIVFRIIMNQKIFIIPR